MTSSGSYNYSSFVAEFYDHVIPYRQRPDVPFYVEAARQSGGPVLELGSGTGRILIPTARAGIEIVGLDSSTHMLDVCRGRLSEEPESIRSLAALAQGDMRDFSLGKTFPLVTVPFRAFQHLLSIDDQLACLACIRRHVSPAGRLVFDLFNPSLEALTSADLGEEIGEEPEFTLPNGSKVIRRHRVVSRDLFNQQNAVELIYYVTDKDGRQERQVHAFPMRYLFRFELEHLLVRSGFTVLDIYADFEKRPYGDKYPGELIVVAERRAESKVG